MEQTFYEVYTDLFMKQRDYRLAIDQLKRAQEVTKKKEREARQMFLLAQLFDIT